MLAHIVPEAAGEATAVPPATEAEPPTAEEQDLLEDTAPTAGHTYDLKPSYTCFVVFTSLACCFLV